MNFRKTYKMLKNNIHPGQFKTLITLYFMGHRHDSNHPFSVLHMLKTLDNCSCLFLNFVQSDTI